MGPLNFSQLVGLLSILVVLAGLVGIAHQLATEEAIATGGGGCCSEDELRDFELYLSTGACEGTCPVTEIRIERGGALRVLPVRDSDVPAYQRTLDRSQLALIANVLASGGLFETPNVYGHEGTGCGRFASDLPVTKWSASLGSRTTELEFSYGCEGAPRRIALMEQRIVDAVREWVPPQHP